jgi:hypothetical protein
VTRLAARSRAAFAPKWRFNRAVRSLVASPTAVVAAAATARVLPAAFEAIVRYAGDCDERGFAGWPRVSWTAPFSRSRPTR